MPEISDQLVPTTQFDALMITREFKRGEDGFPVVRKLRRIFHHGGSAFVPAFERIDHDAIISVQESDRYRSAGLDNGLGR